MDVNDLYREDTYSDRKVGTIRVMTPVRSDGSTDPARASVYVGQAQIMTPAGVLPLSVRNSGRQPRRGLRRLCRGRQDRFRRDMKELQEMRRQQASSIVIPDAGAAAALGQGTPPRGKIQFP